MTQLLDRTTPPSAGHFHNVPLPSYQVTHLSNGIPVYLLPFGELEIAEVQAIFFAGKAYQPQTGVASYTARNMLEGTASYSSLEIAQLLDGQGAWLNQLLGEETLSFRLATLTDRFPKTLNLFREVLFAPSFPEAEFEQMKQRSLEKIRVSQERTSYLALREMKHLLYGPNHLYGAHLGSEELQELRLSQLIDYQERMVVPENCCLTVVGKFDEGKILNWLETTFADLPRTTTFAPTSSELPVPVNTLGRQVVKKSGMQASLRLGHLSIERSHPDFYGLQVMNTLFGGFFGSRLMKNIREEKGYTYGIYSSLVGSKRGGLMMVQTDVSNEYVEDTITEVKKEMHRMIEEPVSEGELQLVKNYLLGQSISQRETPFQIGDFLRFSLAQGVSFEEIDRKFEVFQAITPAEIQTLAQTYLHPDQMLELVVGDPE